MKRVLRYSVPVDGQAHYFDLSGAGTVLHVASREADVVEFWAIEDEGRPKRKREFTVVGTGHPYPDHWQYRGTALTPSGMLVWHLMEVPS